MQAIAIYWLVAFCLWSPAEHCDVDRARCYAVYPVDKIAIDHQQTIYLYSRVAYECGWVKGDK